jgi:excisionase family DNA binding protein
MSHSGQTVPVKSAEYSGPTNAGNLPLVLTKQQLAAIFGCTTRHLDNLTRRGLLPAIHLGRLVRYRRETVLRALANLENPKP